MTRLDARTILLLLHPDRRHVLLLRRDASKRLFPNLITGIGGGVELTRGEGDDLESAVLREMQEETRIPREMVTDLRLRLTTIQSRGADQVLLFWFTARLTATPDDLYTPDGQLQFFDRELLPLELMVPTARSAIPYVLGIPEDEPTPRNATYGPFKGELIPNLP
jgi:8-oxo-dGTP pyrophosphatase MutT (NUDIX family)